MPAYLIVMRETAVRDAEAMAEYQRMARGVSGEFSITPKVIYGALESLEGSAPDGVTMLEFPTMEQAKAWYNSPAYQEALPHRLKAADFRSFIVQGL